MSNNNEIKNDNEYLEFSNQMKEQFNELEAEKKLTEMENYELKKEIVTNRIWFDSCFRYLY